MNTVASDQYNIGNFGSYSGQDFLNHKFQKRDFLVDKLIRQKDCVLLVGNEKSGKSLFVFQLICSLTSQHPFLDKFDVQKSSKVTYVQLEGEAEDSQDRLQRMIKVLDLNPEFFQYLFLPPLQLQDENVIREFIASVSKYQKPDVIIIDPLYFAFVGSLSDDKVVRQFIGNIRVLKNYLNCAVVLVHHTHKLKFNNYGELINEGDDAMFGSKFLKAYPDHTLFFAYDKKSGFRTLSCETQRSGDIIRKCNLRLVEPDPLYFEILESAPTKEITIINLLSQEEYKEGLSPKEIMEKTGMKRNTFYNSLKKPLAEGVIVKTNTKPVIYKINKKG